MIVDIEIQGDRIAVDVSHGKGRVMVGGRELPFDCAHLPDGAYSIILDGRVYDIAVDVNGRSCVLSTRETRLMAEVHDPRTLEPRASSHAGQSGPRSLQAEMPGKVVRILVSEGEAVEFEQGLLVIEAMKMQNEIRSPRRGIVRQIGVREGATVSAGGFLISLE
jgi:biotin carboxyl carrier protein